MTDHISAIVAALTSTLGKSAAHRMDEAPDVEVSGWTNTSCDTINNVIGRPGIPDGRVTTILGKGSSGKSTFVTHLMIEHQKRGGIPFLLPAEPFERSRAEQLGLETNKVVLVDSTTVENNFAAIDTIIDAAPGGDIPTMICWDSFSATPTKAELDAAPGFESKAMAEHARLVSQQMRKLQNKMVAKNTTLIVVLQSKSKVGVTFGSPETYLAERPWYFYSHVQLKFSHIGHVKQGEKEIGIRIKVEVKKNKVAAPFGECEVECLFASGIDSTGPLLEAAVRTGYVQAKGNGRFTMVIQGGDDLKFTRRGWPDVLRQFPTLPQLISARSAQIQGGVHVGSESAPK